MFTQNLQFIIKNNITGTPQNYPPIRSKFRPRNKNSILNRPIFTMARKLISQIACKTTADEHCDDTHTTYNVYRDNDYNQRSRNLIRSKLASFRGQIKSQGRTTITPPSHVCVEEIVPPRGYRVLRMSGMSAGRFWFGLGEKMRVYYSGVVSGIWIL